MSNRDKWEFGYVAHEVGAGARRRLTYHQSRLAFWEQQRGDVIDKLRDSGLDIQEFEVTGGQRAQVSFDPALTRRLDECQAKIRKHQGQIDTYAMWVRVLSVQDASLALALVAADVDFFDLASEEDTAS